MKKKYLAAVIFLNMCMDFAGLSPAQAMNTVHIDYQGKPMMELNYYAKGETSGAITWFCETSEYTFSQALQQGTNAAAQYWSDILGPNSKNTQYWQLFVFGQEKYANANAGSYTFKPSNSHYVFYDTPYLLQILQQGAPCATVDAAPDADLLIDEDNSSVKISADAKPLTVSVINVGDNFGAIGKSGSANRGWYVNDAILLCQNEQEADLVGCFRHELGHGLGYCAETKDIGASTLESQGCTDLAQYLTAKYRGHAYVFPAAEEIWANSWVPHLYDQNGKPAQKNMLIVTNEMLGKLQGTKYTEANCFVLDDTRGMSAEDLAAKRAVQPTYGYAFFKGDHVSEVLDGKKFQGVDGVPINGWEYYYPELSHIQLPVLMSHRSYCNYTSFTEVELAVMQDIGYALDRKAYFGRSIYNDNLNITNTQGYSARNSEGTAYLQGVYSDVSLGLGLHIYGSHNTITQAADILTQGAGSAGMRVDGVGNKLIIAEGTEIHADGKNGVGVMVAYGKDHIIDQKGTVTALGANGNAVQFDFGSSSNGALDEYRGSYIRYQRYVDASNGNIFYAYNDSLHMEDVNTYCSESDELNGALVKEYNVQGLVAGNKNAIYIGKNAFVENINLLDGAQIHGNITSEWKHFSDAEGIYATTFTMPYDGGQYPCYPLRLQYNGKDEENGYLYTEYIPDLVTQVNIMPGKHHSITYADNITGTDNIHLNVKNGSFNYSGTADILGVTVDQGAKLLGGTYTLHDMTSSLAKGFKDTNNSGKFVNNGTIGAATPTDSNTTLTINGDLVLQDQSTVQFTGNGVKTGLVAVNGKVTQADTINVTVDKSGKYLPGSYSVVQEKGSDVALKVADSNTSVYARGLLNATYDTASKNIVFALKDINNLLTNKQNKAVQAVDAARVSKPKQYAGLSAAEQEHYVDFLNSTDNNLIRKVAHELTSNANTQAAQLVQQGHLVGRMVRARMASVNDAKVSVPVQVTPRSLTTNNAAEQQTITTNITVPVEPENSFWAKLDKGWGNAGSLNMHSTGLTFGYDKKYNEHSRAGVLLSYGDSSFSGAQKSDQMKDYRLGFYHDYHRGADDVTVYVDYGQQRHDAKRYTYLQNSNNTYDSRILELGVEYKHDLHAEDGKIFHVAPYINGQASRYWQDGYNEGMLSQKVNAYNGNYLATGLGVELRRYFAQGSYNARLGYKYVWDGASTTMNYNIGSVDFIAKSDLDKHFVTAALGGSLKLNQHGWSLEGDAHIEKGAHDKSYGASALLKWQW